MHISIRPTASQFLWGDTNINYRNDLIVTVEDWIAFIYKIRNWKILSCSLYAENRHGDYAHKTEKQIALAIGTDCSNSLFYPVILANP